MSVSFIRNGAFYTGLGALLTHELDAMPNHEWRVLPLLRSLPDEVGAVVFVVLHVPLFAGILAAVASEQPAIRRTARDILTAFLVLHGGLHALFLFMGHASYEFSTPLSNLLIFGAAGCGLVDLALRRSSATLTPTRSTALEVTAVDHLYVTVRDLDRSEAFYDEVLRAFGFHKGTMPINGERHLHYFNRITQFSIRPAHGGADHDPYAPGLHHLCFRVASREAVDAAAAALRALGIDATEPKLYPEYAPDYYATFFTDPDGIRLEVVAHRALRTLIAEHWDELTEFEDPLRKAGLIDMASRVP